MTVGARTAVCAWTHSSLYPKNPRESVLGCPYSIQYPQSSEEQDLKFCIFTFSWFSQIASIVLASCDGNDLPKWLVGWLMKARAVTINGDRCARPLRSSLPAEASPWKQYYD